MTVKPGYKQTEVGIIPEDWGVKPLPAVLDFIGGKAHEQFISPLGEFIVVNSKFISSEGSVTKFSSHNYCPARNNDILMVMSDLPNGKALAKCFLVKDKRHYAVNQRVCILRARRDNATFLFYYLNRNPYFLKFDDGVQQTHLLNGVFRSCPVVVPPKLEEQEAIAAALSDADEWIASLDRLIAKKRDIKQAAMQQLLTGRIRLPGFESTKGVKETELGIVPEDWRVCRVDEVARVKGGKRLPLGRNLTDVKTSHPYIRVSDMKNGSVATENVLFVPEDVFPLIRNYRIFKNDLYISVAGTLGLVGTVPDELDGANLTENADRVTDISCDRNYLYFALTTDRIQSEIQTKRTVGAQPKLAIQQIEAFRIAFPPTTTEQNAIARVLLELRAEISTLEAQGAKARTIKQGMMQELLTGRIRLI